MNRRVEPEWLDELPATDPRAVGSRRDLRRLNQWMGNAGIMARALDSCCGQARPARLVEFGAGDGHFLLQVASRLGTSWRGTHATLIDRQNLISEETTLHFRQLGWEVEATAGDVLDWCRAAGSVPGSLVVANLFLHHFEAEPLAELLRGIARRSECLVAIEPRRSSLALVFSHLVGLIGCNTVTRHDAPVSVRAGFRDDELSRYWPREGDWTLRERPAGLFGHCFVAKYQPARQSTR